MSDNNNNNNNTIDMILTKLKDANSNNQLSQQVINILHDIYPEVNSKKVQQDPQDNEIILDEFEFNNITYYRDATNNGIWDADAELVGTIKDYDENGEPITCFWFQSSTKEENLFE